MDFHEVNCWLNGLECNGPTSLIMQMTCIVVAQNLRCLKDFGFIWYYIETVYWLPKKTLWILCTIVEHPVTVSMSVRWAQWWASIEGQQLLALHHGKSRSFCCNVYSKSNYSPCFYSKMVATTELLCPKNEHQRSVNDFGPWTVGNARVARRHQAIIELLATCLGKNAFDDFGTMP